ncbi:TPA: DUF58 domain-containing protein [Candidatus Poribacteria bacterium]|nr:DUF58 domain-containing protein [Candidatus Poribacteria bacterium]
MLSPDLLRRLSALRLNVTYRFSGSMRGRRRSPHKGSGLEFADYRMYVPGDELRYLDWRVYARLDRLYLRQFTLEERVDIYLMLDTSGSMGFGKFEMAASIAVGVTHVALSNCDFVWVIPFSDHILPPLRFSSSRGAIGLMERLSDLKPGGDTDLLRSVAQLVRRSPRPGLLFLISDLLDPRGFAEPLRYLLYNRFEVNLIQVLASEELNPTFSGELKLVDAESGEAKEITADEESLNEYRSRVKKFHRKVKGFCEERHIRYLLAETGKPVERVLIEEFRKAKIFL